MKTILRNMNDKMETQGSKLHGYVFFKREGKLATS
jgi:hypothetical protein